MVCFSDIAKIFAVYMIGNKQIKVAYSQKVRTDNSFVRLLVSQQTKFQTLTAFDQRLVILRIKRCDSWGLAISL